MSRLHNARKRLRQILGPLLLALLAVIAALPASSAFAQEVVRFGAHVLLAGDDLKGGEPLPPDFRMPKLPFRYREYRLLDRHTGEAQVGGTQRWPVPGDRQLEITPEAASPVRLRVRLMRAGVAEVNTSIQAAPGHPAVIGGPRHGEGVLIIIVVPGR